MGAGAPAGTCGRPAAPRSAAAGVSSAATPRLKASWKRHACFPKGLSQVVAPGGRSLNPRRHGERAHAWTRTHADGSVHAGTRGRAQPSPASPRSAMWRGPAAAAGCLPHPTPPRLRRPPAPPVSDGAGCRPALPGPARRGERGRGQRRR